MNTIVKGDINVRYHVELGVAGMVDGPARSSMSVYERLSRLKLYLSRWRRFSYTRQTSIYSHRSVWEISSGIIAQGIPFFDEVLGINRVGEFFFSELPGDARGHPRGKDWVLQGYDFPIRDFTIDPTQDLLAIM